MYGRDVYTLLAMNPQAASVFFFGLLAVLFGYLFWANFDPDTVHFVSHGFGRWRLGNTSFDRLLPFAALTVLCGVVAIRSLIAVMRGDSEVVDSTIPSDRASGDGSDSVSDPGPSWTCPGCGEDNPGNFEECWKCQKNRLREGKS